MIITEFLSASEGVKKLKFLNCNRWMMLTLSSFSPADKKNYCDRVDQSMKLGMQVQFGIYNRGAKKNSLIKTNFLKCEILINS